MRERWYADGWELTHGVVRDVEYRDGLYRSAPLSGENVEIGGMDGELWTPKRFGAGSFLLNLWLGGKTRAEVEVAYHTLLLRMVRKHALVRFRRVLADGSARECLGEVVQAIEPQAIGNLGMRASIEVRVPGAFWRDQAIIDTGDLSIAGLSGTAVTLALDAFAGADAPMADLTVHVAGLVNGLRVTTPETGHYFAYSGVLNDGETLVINSATSSLTVPGGSAGNLARFTYTGTRFFELFPRPDDSAPQLRVLAASSGANASLRFVGRRSYLV